MRRPAALALATALAGCTPPGPPPGSALLPAAVVQETLETRLTGEAVSWQAPDGRQRGTVTPTRTFRTRSGYCREYEVTLTTPDAADGDSWHDVACRDEAGIWRDPAVGV